MKTRERIRERLQHAGWQRADDPFWLTQPSEEQAARGDEITVAQLVGEFWVISGRQRLPDNRLDGPTYYTATRGAGGRCWESHAA